MANYSIIGLGKLGASMGAAIASRGCKVIGVDTDRHKVDLVNSGRAPISEPELDELISACRHALRATSDYREAILGSDITFIIVPTPSNEYGELSLQHAELACEQIGIVLAEKQGYHVVVLVSTVLPGSIRHRLLPILEKHSGKKCGADFGLCYNPQFIALGSVIRDFLRPDFTLIGEFDDRSGRVLQSAYTDILPDRPPSRRMGLENAELTKISLNAYLTLKITFANLLADLCERIPCGDVDVVTTAIGLDTRIGAKYLTGSLGYGGPCFPRDNLALGQMARALGACPDLWETTDRINRSWPLTVMERMGIVVAEDTTVAILGLAYKPFSHVLDESQAVYLARELSGRGARVVAHDPQSTRLSGCELADAGIAIKSVDDCLNLASMVVIATPDPVYAALDADDFLRSGRPSTVVIDCWRLLSVKLMNRVGIRYLSIGRSLDDARNAARLASLSMSTVRES